MDEVLRAHVYRAITNHKPRISYVEGWRGDGWKYRVGRDNISDTAPSLQTREVGKGKSINLGRMRREGRAEGICMNLTAALMS